MAKKSAPNCRTCGVCCVSLQDDDIWAELTMADAERLGERWCRRNVLGHSMMDVLCRTLDGQPSYLGDIMTKWRKLRAGPFKGVEVCTCVALRGSILHRVSCSVYEKRPAVCRNALNPGERQCLEARRLFQQAVERV